MSKKPAPMGSGEAIFGSVFGVLFMLYWTGGVIKRRGPLLMVAIGVMMLAVMIKGLFDNIKAYRRRKKEMDFYGQTVYTDTSASNADPWDSRYTQETQQTFSGKLGDIYQYTDREGNIYCPYCGVKIAHDFEYCPKCGRKLPFEINY